LRPRAGEANNGDSPQLAETNQNASVYIQPLFFSGQTKQFNPTFWSELSTLSPSVLLLSTDKLNKVSGIQPFLRDDVVAQELRYSFV
jgi:hypothetical protein